MSAQLRLFVAAYPPLEIAHDLLSRLGRLDLPAHRQTPADQVHLTLQFIGPTSTRELSDVEESVARSVAGLAAFEVGAVGLITLPRGRRTTPRLVAAELDQPAPLMEMQRRLATRLARRVRSKPGDRFLPHMTLCRFGRGVRAEVLDERIDGCRFFVSEVRLMKSVLRPEGAEHGLVRAVGLER